MARTHKFDVKRFNAAITNSGLSTKQLADMAGISDNYVGKLARGERPNVSAPILGSLAEALGVPPTYLLGMDECSELPADLVPIVQYLAAQEPQQRRELAQAIARLLGVDITCIRTTWLAGGSDLAGLVRAMLAQPLDEGQRRRLEELLELLEAGGITEDDLRAALDEVVRRRPGHANSVSRHSAAIAG